MFWAGKSSVPLNYSEEILQPISEYEKTKCMNDFYTHMDPHCIIYGCASCGIRVITTKEQKILGLTINNLSLLKLNKIQIKQYLDIPKEYRKVHGVTEIISSEKSGEKSYYALHRRYLTLEDTTVAQMNSMALLCQSCNIEIKSNKIPKYSLMNGIDFGYSEGKILFYIILFLLVCQS